VSVPGAPACGRSEGTGGVWFPGSGVIMVTERSWLVALIRA
jgi:hypothetical protein